MSIEEVKKLHRRAEALGESAAGVAAAERAVRQADLLGDLTWQRNTRETLIELATFGGFPEKALIAFSWSLAKLDEEPSDDWTHDMLWSFKWILGSLSEWPNFSLQQCEQTLGDALRRYKEEGYSARPLLITKALDILEGITPGEAEGLVEKALSLPRDSMSDCRACEIHNVAAIRRAARDWSGTLDAADSVLDGTYSCSSKPSSTQGLVLLPLCELGRVEEAAELHRRSYARILESNNSTNGVARHLRFLIRTENHGKAIEAFTAYFSRTLHGTPYERLRFAIAAALLFKDLAKDDRGVDVNVRIPREHPLHGSVSGRDVNALAAYFDTECGDLAKRFDERNGNQRNAELIQEAEEEISRKLPFTL